MEKTRITYNSARATCGVLVALSYATIENNRGIFPENPIAYSRGVYGWNCDYYYLADVKGDFNISCGYRPINNVSNRQQEEFRKVFDSVIKNYKNAYKKQCAEQGDSWLSYEQERTLGKRYRKQLAKRLNELVDKWNAEQC